MHVDGLRYKKKKEEERKKNYIVVAVRCLVSYTVQPSMAAGNAGLDVALCVCVCVRLSVCLCL